MQQEILLVGISLDELLSRFEAIFDRKFPKHSSIEGNNNRSIKYLSRAEVATLLKISLPTLHEWTKLKVLQSYKIGNRVLYKYEEVEKAVVQTNGIKYKKNRL